MRRGEVWWGEFDAPVGRRPVLLLSRNEAYDVRDLVIVVPITTRIRDLPTEVPLGMDDGLPRDCVANLDVLTTVPVNRLRERVTVLSESKIQAVDAALRFALGLPHGPDTR